ncbi:class II aldolase/adducin family protein [Amycolatopsis jejuensis]|uniref:class II aldolase/adducin family protein n=1 Tax=Amycolatopsis jejuensis TaxID=330084 RepID=UPI0005241202|nr:class II aldolase/adducin family protein [Amycolatopsis jejuensis]
MSLPTDTPRDLALACRALGSFEIGTGLLAHLTLRGTGGSTFWTYQLGQSLEEVRTADLVEVDFDLHPVSGEGRVNPNLRIHGEIYAERPDVQSIVHHHGANGVVLGALGSTVVPFDQHSARWYEEVALAEVYESPLLNTASASIAKALGSKKALLLKHHGVLVTGSCLADAVVSTVELDKVCGAQLKAMAAGTPDHMPAAEVADVQQIMSSAVYYEATWAYYLRRLTRLGLDEGVDDGAPAAFDAVDVDLQRDYRSNRAEK